MTHTSLRRTALSARSVFHSIVGILMALSPAYGQHSPIQSELARLEQQYGGHLGVMAKNLVTGETVSYNATERFPTASVIKLPVMAAFFHEVDRKAVDPNMRITLLADDKKQDSGVLQFLSNGSTFTILDAVKLMIVLSDNTGTNLVLDRLGATHAERLKVVNDFLASKGLKNTRLLNRLYSWDTKQSTPEGIRYGIGVSTPEDMVTLLEALLQEDPRGAGLLRRDDGDPQGAVLRRHDPAACCRAGPAPRSRWPTRRVPSRRARSTSDWSFPTAPPSPWRSSSTSIRITTRQARTSGPRSAPMSPAPSGTISPVIRATTTGRSSRATWTGTGSPEGSGGSTARRPRRSRIPTGTRGCARRMGPSTPGIPTTPTAAWWCSSPTGSRPPPKG